MAKFKKAIVGSPLNDGTTGRRYSWGCGANVRQDQTRPAMALSLGRQCWRSMQDCLACTLRRKTHYVTCTILEVSKTERLVSPGVLFC